MTLWDEVKYLHALFWLRIRWAIAEKIYKFALWFDEDVG